MTPAQRREQNHAAFRSLKPTIDQTYPRGRYIAIDGGRIVADAGSFTELTDVLKATGKDSPEVLVVQAGVDYPEYAFILVQGVTA